MFTVDGQSIFPILDAQNRVRYASFPEDAMDADQNPDWSKEIPRTKEEFDCQSSRQ